MRRSHGECENEGPEGLCCCRFLLSCDGDKWVFVWFCPQLQRDLLADKYTADEKMAEGGEYQKSIAELERTRPAFIVEPQVRSLYITLTYYCLRFAAIICSSICLAV